MSNLKQLLTDIQDEKNTKLIPTNIKAGVTIMGVTGTYDSGGGGEETPAFIYFEGNNDGIMVCNYGGWSEEYVHTKLDEYLTPEVADAIYTFWNMDPGDPEGFEAILNEIGVENILAIMHAMQVNLDGDEPLEEGYQYFSQFFVEDGRDLSPQLGIINMFISSDTSMDIRIDGFYSASIMIEIDEDTGDEYITLGEIYNMSIDTYEADAIESDVTAGKIFAARGQLLEGTATSMPSASIILHEDNGIIYCDDEAAVNALYDIKNNHFAESFTLAIGINSIKYTYVASFTDYHDPDTGNDTPVIMTFTTDRENKSAEYSFQEDDPEQTHKLELTNVEFDIDIYQ